MTCPEMEAKLAEFLAGELSDRSDVEEHLLACADCRAGFSSARAGWEAASAWTVPGPSGDAISATLASLEPARRPVRLIRALQLGTLAASAAIVFALVSSREQLPASEAPKQVRTESPAPSALASLRPSVGLLFVRDENGRPAGELAIRRLEVRVDIRDGIARTEIEEVFQNRTDRRLEGTFQFPLPPDASISRLAMEIDGKLMEGEVVEREKARQTYEGIVRSMKDPALLEWMPGGIFQCRIFPIEARSDKRIVIAYTQALSVFDGKGRYVYPLAGESMRELGIERFEFAATVRSTAKLAASGSTSHDAPTIRIDDRTMRTTFAHSDFRPRADFVVAYETESPGEIQVAVHRPAGEEPGYFAAFVTPRSDPEEDRRRDRRICFLLDVSGSVARAELEAARLVVRRMIQALGPNDRFRIASHNILVGSMTEFVAPDEAGRRAAERYLADLAPAGASDVAAALETILREMPDDGEVAYIGEGTPTWGEKDPAAIVARARTAMGTKRVSIRTIAVGSDAEKGLLETIAREFNGGAHAVSPSDEVRSRADEIARSLGRSALSDVKAEFEGGVADAAPGKLGSIHFGERLLVTGRYAPGKAKLVLTGRVHDRTIRREFALDLPEREDGNLHVKRLWAQRRLADLAAQGEAKRAETVALSVRHQVMTPYTSFLVLENEKAYEQHQIDRTKKDADQSKDPKIAASEQTRKREVIETIAHLLEQAYTAFDQRRFDRAVKLCDEVLAIDPRYTVAAELKEDAQKSRHREDYYDFTKAKRDEWRKQTHSSGEAVIPKADTVVLPNAEQWADISKRPETLAALKDGEKVRQTIIEDQRAREVVRRKLDQRRELETLFYQAQVCFENQRYDLCIDVCDRILFIDPRLNSVDELKMFAQRLSHAKSDPEQTRTHIEQWKRSFENVEMLGVVQPDELSFPARKLWAEVVKRRNPDGVVDFPAVRHTPDLDGYAGDSASEGDLMLGWGYEASGYLRLPSGANFSDPGEEGLDITPGLLPPYDPTDATRYSFLRSNRLPLSQGLPRMVRASPTDLREDGYYSERHAGLDYWLDRHSAMAGASFSLQEPAQRHNLPILGDLPEIEFLFRRRLTGRGPMGRAMDDPIFFPELNETEASENSIALRHGDAGKLSEVIQELLKKERGVERSTRELGDLENDYLKLMRERQETTGHLNTIGLRTDVVFPRKALAGQVTAVAQDQNLVVISIGRDIGVNEGDEFTIYRGNEFVCKIIMVDRVDRAWASGRVVLKGKLDPIIGDQAFNNVLATPGKSGMPALPTPPPPPRKVITIAGDEIGLGGVDPSTVKAGDIFVLARDWQYVAAVQVISVAESGVKARILGRLRALPVQEGDAAVRINSTASLWSVLPAKIRQEVISERVLAEARAKLRWLRGGAR